MRNTRDCKENTGTYREVSSDRNIYGSGSVNQSDSRRTSGTAPIFPTGERKGNDRRRISFLYGTGTDDFVWCHAWKNQKAVSGKDESDTKKLLELLMDTWIDEVENELKENAVYQKMLEKYQNMKIRFRQWDLKKKNEK